MERLIDAKQLEKQVKEAVGTLNPVLMGQMLRWIRKQQTVDAVHVVRCKDCKHGSKSGDLIYCYHPEYDLMEGVLAHEAGFYCAYGEREKGDE